MTHSLDLNETKFYMHKAIDALHNAFKNEQNNSLWLNWIKIKLWESNFKGNLENSRCAQLLGMEFIEEAHAQLGGLLQYGSICQFCGPFFLLGLTNLLGCNKNWKKNKWTMKFDKLCTFQKKKDVRSSKNNKIRLSDSDQEELANSKSWPRSC